MKKIFIMLIIGLSTQMNYSQNNTINVKISTPDPIGDALNRNEQSANADRIARTKEAEAYNEAMKNNYSNVTIDNLINNSNNYKYLVIENVSGWYPKGNKEEIINILTGANKYIIIDASKNYKSREKDLKSEKKIADNLIQNNDVLYLLWVREAQGDINRITQLSVKNSEGKIVYESTSKNLSYGEILKPLISNYIYTKEQALSKIEEFKKYLDLGIITKEEYDSKVFQLKPILLGEN